MAHVDFFLKIDGIDGESTDDKHKGEIDVDSWSFAEAQAGHAQSGGGLGAGKVKLEPFQFTAKLSKASPKLLLACANGEHIKKAVLLARKAGKNQQEYLKFTLSDVLVSTYKVHGAGGAGGVIPTEQFTLVFSKIELEIKEQNADGTVGAATKAGWDAKANVKV